MKTLPAVLAFVCVAGAVSACRESLAPQAIACPGDTVTVAVTGSARTPQFSWTPACLMGWIEVDQADTTYWFFITGDSNRVGPPLGYGAARNGMQAVIGARALAPGVTYTLTLYRWLEGQGSGSLFKVAGAASFTP